MLKVEHYLHLWVHVQIVGADHQLASGIASALGMTMQEDAEMQEYDPAYKLCFNFLDSNDEYSGSFSFNTDSHEQPILSLYIDLNSEHELRFNALGGESWLKNLLKEYSPKIEKID